MREIVDGLGYAPRSCTWELTLACNLRCGHCGSRAGTRRPGELGEARLLGIARELAELGCRTLTLSGGEPTLSPHWEAVGAEAAKRGIAVNMITNGVRADRELARRARDAGLVSVAVSLDGLEQTHDRYRGRQGLFRRALAFIEGCNAEGLPVGAITTIQKRNLAELDALAELLTGRVYVWQLQIGAKMGSLADHADEQIEPRDLLTLIPALAALIQRSALNIRIANNIGYYGPHEATLRRHRSTPVDCWVGCYAGCRHLGIEADGGVKGCLSLQATSRTEGNLRTMSLAEIWNRDDAFAYTRRFSLDDLSGFCRSCEHAGVCRGGCFSMRSCEGGRDNPYCYHRVATLEARSGAKSARRYAPLVLAPAALLAAFGIGCTDRTAAAPPAAPTAEPNPFPGEPPAAPTDEPDPFPGEPPTAPEYAAPEPEPPPDTVDVPLELPPPVPAYAIPPPPSADPSPNPNDDPPMTVKYGVPRP